MSSISVKVSGADKAATWAVNIVPFQTEGISVAYKGRTRPYEHVPDGSGGGGSEIIPGLGGTHIWTWTILMRPVPGT